MKMCLEYDATAPTHMIATFNNFISQIVVGIVVYVSVLHSYWIIFPKHYQQEEWVIQ